MDQAGAKRAPLSGRRSGVWRLPLRLDRPEGGAIRRVVRGARLPGSQEDIERIVTILNEPRLGPLLLDALESLDVTEWAWEALRRSGLAGKGDSGPAGGAISWTKGLFQAWKVTLGRSVLLLDARDELETAAAHEGLHFVRQKGIAVLESLYELRGRRLSDLDFYVPPGELKRAAALVQRLGYERAPSPRWPKGAHHELAFVRKQPDSVVGLELHPEEGAWWWGRTLPPEAVLAHTVRQGPGLKPTSELLAAQLGLHILRSEIFSGRLKNVVDLGLLLAKAPPNWRAMEHLLARARLWKPVQRLLALLERIFWPATRPSVPSLEEDPWLHPLLILADLRPRWPPVWLGDGPVSRQAATALTQSLFMGSLEFSGRASLRLAALALTGR